MSDRQLATLERNGHMDLAKFAKAVAQAQAQQTEKAITDAVVAVLDQTISITKSGQSPVKENISFARVGRGVVKLSIQLRNYDLTFNAARGGFFGSWPQPLIDIEQATEADLLDLERQVTQNGSGSDVIAVRELLRIVRDQPAEPLAVQIINPREIGATEKVLSIRRDDSGKLSGATSMPIS